MKFKLNNGLEIPCIGFGTYNPQGGDNSRIIQAAIEAGYRYFDTASLYGTERALGQAVKESRIDRRELFIASKLWTDEMGYEETKQAFERSLNRLQMDYLDMYLIHWPRQSEQDEGWKERCIETWRAMEELHKQGRIRGLGLSNFLPHHMQVILDNCEVKPNVNQLELHPGYVQESAVRFGAEHGVLAQAWSPLGRKRLMEHPLIVKMASKYGKAPAQICLRFLYQQHIMSLVKSVNPERMKGNLDIFDFEIEWEDMSLMMGMPQEAWSGEHPDFSVPKVRSNFTQ